MFQVRALYQGFPLHTIPGGAWGQPANSFDTSTPQEGAPPYLGLDADTRGLDFLGWPLRVTAAWALQTLDRLRAARQSGPHGGGFTAFAFESNRALGSGYKQT